MIRRFKLEDWRIIAHYLGVLILVLAAAMFIPLIISLLMQEFGAFFCFLTSISISAVVGTALMFCHIDKCHMNWRQALVITGFAWVVLAAFGALPLWFSNYYIDFLDSFFESISALTTAGYSMAVDLDHTPYSLITWRVMMNLMGGVGVLVIAVSLGIFGSGSGVAALYEAEARGDHVLPEVKQTSRFIAKITAVVVTGGFVLLLIPMLIIGIEPVRAIFNSAWLSMSSFSTSGMAGPSSGLMYFHCWPIEVFTLLIMLFGVVNFLLYGDLWNGRIRNFFKDIEIRTLFIWISAMMLAMAIVLVTSSYFTDLGSLIRRGLYLIVSATANTGLMTLYPGQILYSMSSGALFIVVVAMAVGGSASSTTGGIKALRLGIIVKTFFQIIRSALAPERAMPRTFFYHQGKKLLTSSVSSSAMLILLLYLVTFVIGALVGIAYGYDPLPSIFESVGATSNAGVSAGIISVGMPDGLEIVYMVQMWFGRLEFIALIAMFIQIFVSIVPKRKRRKSKNKPKVAVPEI